MHTACLKMLTDHSLLIGGGWRTENFPWDLTFFARMKSCHWGQDGVISLVTGAYSRSLLHFTWGVISRSEQKFVTAYLTDKLLENFHIKKKWIYNRSLSKAVWQTLSLLQRANTEIKTANHCFYLLVLKIYLSCNSSEGLSRLRKHLCLLVRDKSGRQKKLNIFI